MGKKRGFLIRGIISIILGFLPSFLFVTLLIQGSPLTNYINFLKDLKSSWWAWACAGGLIIFFFLFWSLIQYLRNPEKKRRKKFALIVFIFLFAIIFFLILTQVYLYGKFLLGSDLLIKLSADKDNLFFSEDQNQDVTFKISATMNPFCIAECSYQFFDLSSGNLIESGEFNMTSIFSKSKTYTLNKTETTESQKLNRFDIKCKTQKARFCYTKAEEITRSILITLNYGLSEEQKKIMNESKERIIELKKRISSIEQDLNESDLNIAGINNSFSAENLSEESSNLHNQIQTLNNSIMNLEDLWKIKKIFVTPEEIIGAELMIRGVNQSGIGLKEKIASEIYLYNSLIENITYTKSRLNEMLKFNLTNSSCDKLDEKISGFNVAISEFINESDLTKKEENIKKIASEILAFYQESKEESGEICPIETAISGKNFSEIRIVSLQKVIPEFYLEEPEPLCCFYGKCEKCCDENCSNKNYPVIFLHGHSVNKALPADYSLDALAKIKGKLSDEGYVDAGAILISSVKEQPGLWGRVNAPVAVTASYFFEVYRTEDGGEITVPSKTDSIDTYAIRLRDIIETVKYRTNKDKVIIVAHSMGGLVTRRYTEVFGDSNIEKAIFITIPNHGIDGKVRDYCSILGEKSTCEDMDKDSIFINKLDSSPPPGFPTENIIGFGCVMGDETGDGIVKNSSQFLSYANNYYIEGKCNELSFDFLHESIVDPDKYPAAYEIIRNSLNITRI